METISLSRRQEATIRWKQLWSLASLYGSVIVGWIAYENYQPRLLTKFQFTEFAFLLAVIQALILVITPPVAGAIGDRFRLEKGHRLPVITAGISFAAMIFMAVAFTLLSSPGDLLRWILPVLIVCWLVAMSIFTSPALSTLELFTPVDKLPRAMAVLTIVGNLVYAVEPVIVDIIDYIGAPLTFIVGGIAVFLSGYFLQKHSLALFRTNDYRETVMIAKPKEPRRLHIFLLGVGLGIPTMFLFTFLPGWLSQQGPIAGLGDEKIILVALLVFVALVSLPASRVANQLGIVKSYGTALAIVAASAAAVAIAPSVVIATLASLVFASAFAVLSVSALPLAMNLAQERHKVFYVGVFFSGVALPECVMQAVMLN